MTKQTVISARVDEAMLDDLDRIAAFHDRSRAWVIAPTPTVGTIAVRAGSTRGCAAR